MQNKRGQGLSTNAIILIILGVVILAILIIGFTMGWKTLAPWMSKNNVNTIVSQCKIGCSTNSVYDYCSKERTLRADDLPNNQKEVVGNCTFFSEVIEYEKYGIKDCPTLLCS